MRRGMRGGTTGPTMVRPGMGYGRPLRPTPPRVTAGRAWPEASWWAAPATPVEEPVAAPPTHVAKHDHR